MSGYSRTVEGYALTHSECHRVHKHANHRAGIYCSCNPCPVDLLLGSDEVFDHAWSEHFEPEGFERLPHPSKAILLLIGNGIGVGDTSRLWRALGVSKGCSLYEYRVERDAKQFKQLRRLADC